MPLNKVHCPKKGGHIWYLYHEPLPQARIRIKEGIKRYNLSVGGQNTDHSGYHETITEFYIRILMHYQLLFPYTPHFRTLMEGMKQQPFAAKDFPLHYYSKALLMSRTARRSWVSPDVKPLPASEFHPHEGRLQSLA